jgi:hypothetical protein
VNTVDTNVRSDWDPQPNDVRLRTEDHPLAAGRTARPGERCWTIRCRLEDGRRLLLEMGEEGHKVFRGFMLREDLDDFAEGAMRTLEGGEHA